jgi:hypothetical protein
MMSVEVILTIYFLVVQPLGVLLIGVYSAKRITQLLR